MDELCQKYDKFRTNKMLNSFEKILHGTRGTTTMKFHHIIVRLLVISFTQC